MPHSGVSFLFPTESEMCVPVCEQDIKAVPLHAMLVHLVVALLGSVGNIFKPEILTGTLCSSAVREEIRDDWTHLTKT